MPFKRNRVDHEAEYRRLGIADGHNDIKGKQLFVLHRKTGNLCLECFLVSTKVASPCYVLLVKMSRANLDVVQHLTMGIPVPSV